MILTEPGRLEASMLERSEHDGQAQENSQEVLKKARDALTQAMMDEAAASQVLEVEPEGGQDLEPSAEVVEQIRHRAQEAVFANISTEKPWEPGHEEKEEEQARESVQMAIFSLVGNQPDEEELAASRIGAAVRGQQTRKRLQVEYEAAEIRDMAKKTLTQEIAAQVEDAKKEEAAATKIGANVRGQQTR